MGGESGSTAGYPERYAQEALGHSSAAIHRAYAKKARVELPPLDEFEKQTKTEGTNSEAQVCKTTNLG